MKRGREYIKKKTGELESLFGKFKKTNLKGTLVANGQSHHIDHYVKQDEINREIIRRLRIQNKKLIEQAVKLKEQIKKTRFNKNQVLNHINDLLKLIN